MQLKVNFPKALLEREIGSPPETFKNSFVPQWIFLKESIVQLDAMLLKAEKPFNPILSPTEGKGLKENLWGFEYWYQIKRTYPTLEELYTAIRERLQEIEQMKELARALIAVDSENPIYKSLGDLALFNLNGTYNIDPLHLKLAEDGISGSYFLMDSEGNPRFVVKPLDEDIGCINNRKGFSTPFDMSPIRQNMPLYRSSFREAAAYLFASAAGIGSATPRTTIAILESDAFYDLLDQIDPMERKRFLEECGAQTKEKLVSVQEYLPNSKPLFEALQDFQMAGLTDDEIAARFDQNDVEEANLLLWLTYDTDGHGGNFLVYPKGFDAIGNEILGIKKIDNGLAFPDKNSQLRNALSYLPNGKLPLSDSLREKIQALDFDKLSNILKSYGLESAIPALRQRIDSIQKIALDPTITLKEFNTALSKIDLSGNLNYFETYSYSNMSDIESTK